jgi:hypothetical protein
MTEEELKGKFRSLAGRSLAGEQVRELVGFLDELEDLRNVKRLARHFKPAQS